MPLHRPSLISQGQANDFYANTSIGTGLMFLAGGLAAGPAAIALGLCGMGAVASNRRESGRNAYNPKMIFRPPNTAPLGPLSNPNWRQEAYDALAEREAELERQFGINAVYCYRQMILDGLYQIKEAYDFLYPLVETLRSQSYWGKVQIQSGQLTPKQLLDQITGRRVASPELQWFSKPDYFPGFYQGVYEKNRHRPDYLQDTLVVISLWICILGLTSITNMAIRRIKMWWDRISNLPDGSKRQPLYYVSGYDWFVKGTVEQIVERWNWLIYDMMVGQYNMPQHLVDECDDLWHYRVETHRGDEPPGHPGGVIFSNVLFGRTKCYPATEEDMMGRP